MTYNSTVTLKGVPKPIFTSKSNATQISDTLANDKVPFDFVIRIGNMSFRKGDIKFVEVLNDGNDTRKNDDEMKAFYDEERKTRDAFVKLSPEAKASRIDMFFYLYKIATGGEPNADVIEKVKNIQKQFFVENPNRTLCDVHILKSLIPNIDTSVPHTMWDGSKSMFKRAYLSMVEKVVFRDMELSGQLK